MEEELRSSQMIIDDSLHDDHQYLTNKFSYGHYHNHYPQEEDEEIDLMKESED